MTDLTLPVPDVNLPVLNIYSEDAPLQNNLPAGYIPKNKRKKILLLSDDLRMPSGVGTMSREIVLGTSHRYNWIQLGAAINHPDAGKVMDASDSLSKELGIPDASLKIFPYNGYGDHNVIRYLMMTERPDAILHFTDPRYWLWLYHMEAEIRETVPLAFYHVWDDLPFPKYNVNYYRSCDLITCISRQTYNIVKNVWLDGPKPEKWQIKYIPHGINPKLFYNVTADDELKAVTDLRKKMFAGEEVDFVVFYNNRNIRRKMTGDVILAYRHFLLQLPKEKQDKCRLLLHTQPVDDNGTDLYAVFRDVAPEVKFVFSTDRVPPSAMNLIYNNVDVVINMASNEGFGLSTLEGIMSERIIIANVTGGLQDQMGFRDEKGELLHEDKHYGSKWGSNHDGRYKTHGEWVVPVFPNNLSLNGSPPTPYIFDDRADWREAGNKIMEVYKMSKAERVRRGALGRQYCLENGFTSADMCKNFIESLDAMFANWKPRKRWNVYKA